MEGGSRDALGPGLYQHSHNGSPTINIPPISLSLYHIYTHTLTKQVINSSGVLSTLIHKIYSWFRYVACFLVQIWPKEKIILGARPEGNNPLPLGIK